MGIFCKFISCHLAKSEYFPYTLFLMTDLPSELHQQAICAALSAKWLEAISLNEQILKTEPKNVDTLNRLARAYFELGQMKKAKEASEEALRIDPYNQIAFKFLKRIEACRKKNINQAINKSNLLNHSSQLLTDLFIEEPGKSKQVILLKVAEPQKLSRLSAGEPVNLIAKNRAIAVTDQCGEYLGVLPDDLSHRLLRLIKGGNKYQALIKNAKPNGLSILIKEVHRCTRFKNQPSFLDTLNLTSTYSSDHIVVLDQDSQETEGLTDEEETS